MARSVIRLDDTELKCFHENYIYMWKKLNTAPYYVSGFGDPPSWIRNSELLPSYVNLSKCMNSDYVPSVNLVNKIVHFYNANITPSIDTYAFLHEILELNDRCRTAISCASLEPYCGLYYGYYFSEAENGRFIRGCILKLFETDGELRANGISDITYDADMQNADFINLLDSTNLLESFTAFKDKLPLSKSLISLFTGSGKISPGVVSLQLQRLDSDGINLILQLPSSEQRNGKYLGGLGMVFMVTADHTFQLYRFGLERADFKDLLPVSLEDSKLKDLLSLSKGINERITMTPSDNTSWINYIVLSS